MGTRPNARENEKLPLAQPKLVGQFEFVEWTPDRHLRDVKFAGLREDKDARHVRREGEANCCYMRNGATPLPPAASNGSQTSCKLSPDRQERKTVNSCLVIQQ